MSLRKTFLIREGPDGIDPNQGSGYGARAEAIWKQLGDIADIKLVGDSQAQVVIAGAHGHVEFTVEFDGQGKILDIWD